MVGDVATVAFVIVQGESPVDHSYIFLPPCLD